MNKGDCGGGGGASVGGGPISHSLDDKGDVMFSYECNSNL